MATSVTASLHAGETERTDAPRPAEKSFVAAWLEYIKLLGAAGAIGTVVLVGPIVALLLVTYIAYLLSRLLGV